MADHQLRLSGEASAGEGQQQQQQQQQQRSDRGTTDTTGDDFNRPSFTGYWQGEKESEMAGRVLFVNEGQPHISSSSTTGMVPMAPPPLPEDQQQQQGSASSADKAKEKAKLRRQQVRKAQIQHRTRKANYIKQLELDVCKFRDMIAAAEKEVLAYRRENEGMRGTLKARGLRTPGELKGKEKGVLVGEVRIADEAAAEGDAPSYDEVVHQPVEIYEQPQSHIPEPHQPVRQGQTDTQVFSEEEQQMLPYETSVAQPLDYDPYPPVDMFGDVSMGDITVTMRKDDTLGTPCFQISSSSTSSSTLSSPPRPATPDQLSVEQEIIAINLILAMEHICWNHFHPRQYPRHADPCKAASGHTMMASTMCMSSAPERVYRSIRRKETETRHTWDATSGAGSALSLKSLLSLAKALNPGDIELTPVQAWFELAGRYGAAALMEDRVVEALKREFCGVVDCIHFGAIIERDAFESVVARVMSEVGVPELPYEMDVDAGFAGPEMMAGAQRIAA